MTEARFGIECQMLYGLWLTGGSENMNVIRFLLDLLYPPRCPFCGRVLDRVGDGACARCQAELPWTKEGEQGKNVDFCDVCLSPFWYRGRVPDAIHRYKFQSGQIHANVLGTWMAQCLSDRWKEPVDLITWVPLSPRRRRERGYDQARLLAERVGELTGYPVLPTLEKIRETQVQSRLDEASVRRANVQGAYRVAAGADLSGKRIVLVDDVATSGATLSECAACLRMAGAESVAALTLARARK